MGDVRKKKGQVTIFIIIGLIIVAAALLIFAFAPNLKTTTGLDIKNPNLFLQKCVEEDLTSLVETISLQGGSVAPTNYYLYQDNKLEYLCDINEPYTLCIVQQPFLRGHIEEEINKAIKSKVDSCFDALVKEYQSKGYVVQSKKGIIFTKLLPEKIVASLLNYEIIANKGGTENFKSFSIILDNNLYELVSIATNIVDWETTVGEADANSYMMFYPYLQVLKPYQDIDGTKVYILKNVETGETFQFVSRSNIYPSGL